MAEKQDEIVGELWFNTDEVAALLEHTKAATAFRQGMTYPGEPGPALVLVREHGIFLMSNGDPPVFEEDGVHVVVAYAQGFDPSKDEGFSEEEGWSWYDRSVELGIFPNEGDCVLALPAAMFEGAVTDEHTLVIFTPTGVYADCEPRWSVVKVAEQ